MGIDFLDEKVVCVLVKGIFFFVEDSCVKNMLEGFGVKLISDIKYEKICYFIIYCMIEILNGNCFVYMLFFENDVFLLCSVVCVGFCCIIVYKG